MFDHLDIAVSDLEASRTFYELALGAPTAEAEWLEWGDFGITPVDVTHPLTQRLHVGFGVESRDAVDTWWHRMVDAGYRSDGEPGSRPEYNETYYGAFTLDPDGNSVEAVHHNQSRTAEIDHVWLRTTDLAKTRRLYEAIAPAVGISIGYEERGRVGFSDGDGSFTFVQADEPSRHVHLAFGVSDLDAIADFHRRALEAGFIDNGPPGERPEYHPGYFGAFALDNESNNVEAVLHQRPV